MPTYWQRFQTVFFVLKAVIVSFLLFAALNEFKRNGWDNLVLGNLVMAAWFSFTTFFIMHLAKKKGLS